MTSYMVPDFSGLLGAHEIYSIFFSKELVEIENTTLKTLIMEIYEKLDNTYIYQ